MSGGASILALIAMFGLGMLLGLIVGRECGKAESKLK